MRERLKKCAAQSIDNLSRRAYHNRGGTRCVPNPTQTKGNPPCSASRTITPRAPTRTCCAPCCDTNLSATPGYGLDDDCRRAADAIRARFACPDADVHFLVGGTQTNLLAATAFLRPWEAMVAADTGHVNVHETGAIEATGHKVIAVPGADGKLTPAAIADAAAQHCAQPGIYDEHMVLPRMAYISDTTELGTVYTKAELTALRAACDAHGLYLYLDGARLAQALTAAGNDLSPEDLPQLCDAFYIGGTKNGLLFGEAMVIVNDALKPGFRRAMKRSGAMLAKGRLLGVQFAAALEQDLWLDMGRHANAQAQRIAAALSNLGVPMYVPSPTNQIFPILPDAKIAQLQERAAFYTNTRVDETHQAVRFVTSWATTDAQIDALLAVLNEVLG